MNFGSERLESWKAIYTRGNLEHWPLLDATARSLQAGCVFTPAPKGSGDKIRMKARYGAVVLLAALWMGFGQSWGGGVSGDEMMQQTHYCCARYLS